MKTVALTISALALAAGPALASGPDASPAPQAVANPTSPVAFNWTGPYAGVVGSFGQMRSETTDHWCWVACDGGSLADWGGAAGLSLGYDVQNGSFVYGVVADINWSNFENRNVHVDSSGTPSYQSTTEAHWNGYATLRGRAGLAVDRTLVYATGGVALVDVEYRHDYRGGGFGDNGGFRPYSDTETGFAAGAGVEHAFGNNMSVSAEYLYIGLPSTDGGQYYGDLDDPDSARDGTVDYRSDAHLVRVGLNYRF